MQLHAALAVLFIGLSASADQRADDGRERRFDFETLLIRQIHKENLMIPARPGDSWNQGDPYERYIGCWSVCVADAFLDWLDLAPGLRWLDVASLMARHCLPCAIPSPCTA
ncbi:MAG: hypothetical protein ABI440_05645 [Casimicrobiaceae bacterium]